ncbi:MAG: ribosome maturation factor RimP [Arachnia sp.]
MHEQQLTELITPILLHNGLELDELEIKPMGKRSLLRITVDGEGPEGRGPLLDDISLSASHISAALDVSEAVGNLPFTLEVSSRGISKPLSEPKHFRRNTGRLVTVKAGASEITGRILSVSGDEVLLDVKGKEMRRKFVDITKAVVQIEMNPPKELQEAEASEDDSEDINPDEEA